MIVNFVHNDNLFAKISIEMLVSNLSYIGMISHVLLCYLVNYTNIVIIDYTIFFCLCIVRNVRNCGIPSIRV